MATSTLDRFLGEVAGIVEQRDGLRLQQYLIIEPPLPPDYSHIVNELQHTYPEFNQGPLEEKCKSYISEYEEGEDRGSRATLISFLVRYFSFLRDVNPDNLIETYDLIKGLLNQCILALGSYIGLVVLPTTISLSRSLSRLAIGLDKRPDLIAHLTQRDASTSSEATERITLVERSANVIREAFKKCLSERSGPPSGIDSDGKPEGRRVGIYLAANLCLKLFFHCKKLRSAEQIFGNIYQQSPPLSLFPASQRVTFLYYLGRYLFANNHFFRAQLTLQAAYDQCHPQFLNQRRIILIYLTTSNLILGRFPSVQLFRRPEAAGLQEKFEPLCKAIARGDLCSFRRYVDMDSRHADWFLQKRILLQISDRCEVLVWRSLARRTFLLSGSRGDAAKRTAPTLRLEDLLTLALGLELEFLSQPEGKDKLSQSNGYFTNGNATSFFNVPKTSSPLAQPPQSAEEGSNSALPPAYVDEDLADDVDEPPPLFLPTMEIVESIIASLVEQDLIHGFISHALHRLAITGAKTANPLHVGFPKVWDVIQAKADTEVPGWVKGEKRGLGQTAAPSLPGRFGPGMVVNLSGARPVGAASG